MNTIGNTVQTQQLFSLVKNNNLPHAILLIGPAHIGKSYIAKKLAYNLLDISEIGHLESHSEFIHIEKKSDARQLVVDDIRHMLERQHHKAFTKSHRVILIQDIHACTTQAANALLKSIEEPADSTFYILTATHAQTIPQTIISRCALYHFSNVSHAQMQTVVDADAEEAHTKKKLTWAAGRPGLLKQLQENDELHAQWYDESRELLSLLTSTHDKRLVWVEKIIGRGAKAASKDALCARLDRHIVMLRALIFSHGLKNQQLASQLIRSIDTAHEVKDKIRKNVQSKGLCDAYALSLPRL